ncbi:OmpA family protein [Aquirufa antheringensis]|uniref:OmpA family protein n=1 Tax=Aquirufa antheringensis TaxID=2516559 RepID=UPI0022A8A201|nr:OmpA family protein [Aquirufa antheringensis]MCZ2487262.1 OmpA family protein [Aquirufa antheringensis]MCZ2489753.1 OmpA family protein [Aquirufa antheringensis]
MRKLLFFLLMSGFLMAQKAPENLGSAVNSEFSELNPVISPDGRTLYFGRKNHPANRYGVKGSETISGSQDIWFSEKVGDTWSSARRLSEVLNRDQYNTILSISPDGQTILLKGAYVNGAYETRGFSISNKTTAGWTVPVKVDIPGYEQMSKGKNEYGYLTMDGKAILLAFARKKNSEDDDLYISFFEDGRWTRPLELGEEINTKYSETTPFLSADGKTLYFSSDRPGGQGSQDIYLTRRLDDTWQHWRKPQNLGSPINTDEYDAYYSIAAKGDYAYFMSGKGSLGKKDIFRLALEAQSPPGGGSVNESSQVGGAASDLVKGSSLRDLVKESPPGGGPVNGSTRSVTSQESDPVVLLSGTVLNQQTGKVPEDASVTYEDLSNGKVLGQAKPDPTTGKYKLVLPYGKNYGITAKAKGLIPTSTNLDLTTMRGRYLELDDRDLSMVPLVKGNTATINNLFFDLGKATLKPESEPELKRILQVMKENVALIIEISGHTDNTGSDEINNKLSLERANAVKENLLKGGIDQARIKTKGYGKSKPKADNATEEGRQINRRVEIEIL